MRFFKISMSVFIALCLFFVASLYLFPKKTLNASISAARFFSGLEKKSISFGKDLNYVYLDNGQKGSDAEALMLLHGFGANKDNFTAISRFLGKKYRVIVPDHIGFGESSHPVDADYSPTAQAERLHKFVTALGIKKIHIGGSSMGGHIALTYAALYPDETASLWLLDPGGVWTAPDSELKKVALKTGKNPLQPKTIEEYENIPGWVMHKPPSFPKPILKVMADERINNSMIEDRVFRQILEDSAEERVKGMNIPALIVWGERDRVLSVDSADILHKLMPASKVIVMKDTGHLPMIENPKQCAEDYIRFRSSI